MKVYADHIAKVAEMLCWEKDKREMGVKVSVSYCLNYFFCVNEVSKKALIRTL